VEIQERPLSRRLRPILFVLFLLPLVGCGQNAAPAAPTASPPSAAAKPPSSAQVSAALSPLPKPSASPAAAASPAAQGAPVSAATKQFSAPPSMSIDPSKHYTATIDTSMGTMKADLYASDAPTTVNNFVFLARQGFYDGVTFHRVINNFMVQTGDPTGTGTGGPGYRFNDEPVTRKYVRGTLAMANAGPNTNGSQFFIVHKDYPLPPNYTIFGQVTDGLDVLDKIATTPTGPGKGGPDTPRTPVTINSIKIDES
jgi:cyclophilin family peptidyl-prolyl cis-trans isomerase